MPIIQHLAKHLRDVHFGGNWTCSNLRDQVKGLSWQEATTKVHDFNTIATLVYHIHYFVHVVIPVLEGGSLDANDTLSFNHPPIHNQEDWETFLQVVWRDAEHLATLIEQLPEEKLWTFMADEKYGSYYRNLQGTIEHTHYHLGQIALIKKLIQQTDPSAAGIAE